VGKKRGKKKKTTIETEGFGSSVKTEDGVRASKVRNWVAL